jgi:hypothetical protein
MPYAWSMRTIHAAGPLAVALVLVSSAASAQRHHSQQQQGQGQASQPGAARAAGPAGPKQQTFILEKEQLGTAAFASVARARMHNGDYAGALDAFDAAILTSIDASLRRDRGLCHEQLGQPYPAIDDYRAYLTSEPDAPDAEGIRGRLAQLEQQTSGKSSQNDDDTPPPASIGASATAAGSVSVGVAGNAPSADAQAGAAPSGDPPDSMDTVQHDNDMMRSSLRRGRGFGFAPYFSEHKWFFQGSNLGDSDTWAECVGLQLRYSFGRTATLFLEGAYQHFNSTADSTSQVVGSIQGLTSQLALELRFPLDPDYNNQLIVAPGIGFDHIVVSTTLASGSSDSEGALVPRARFGWRHMVDNSAAVDLSLDVGVGKFSPYTAVDSSGSFPFGGPGSAAPMLALNVALVWGL